MVTLHWTLFITKCRLEYYLKIKDFVLTESTGDVGDGIVAGRERGPGGQLYGDEVAGADVE